MIKRILREKTVWRMLTGFTKRSVLEFERPEIKYARKAIMGFRAHSG